MRAMVYVRFSSVEEAAWQKSCGGVYAEFLRRQIPFPTEMQKKSQYSMPNFLYTEKISPETPLFKISGVWDPGFYI